MPPNAEKQAIKVLEMLIHTFCFEASGNRKLETGLGH